MRYFGECFAVVAVERIGAPIGDIEVLVAVAVVVGGSDAHAVARIAAGARIRVVGKVTLALVAVEVVARSCGRCTAVKVGAIY